MREHFHYNRSIWSIHSEKYRCRDERPLLSEVVAKSKLNMTVERSRWTYQGESKVGKGWIRSKAPEEGFSWKRAITSSETAGKKRMWINVTQKIRTWALETYSLIPNPSSANHLDKLSKLFRSQITHLSNESDISSYFIQSLKGSSELTHSALLTVTGI